MGGALGKAMHHSVDVAASVLTYRLEAPYDTLEALLLWCKAPLKPTMTVSACGFCLNERLTWIFQVPDI